MSGATINRNRRWTLFGVLALIYILVYFYRVSLAVVAGDISRELGLSPAELGKLSGILFYVYACAQLPLGPMIDRLGGRVVISGCGILTTMGGLLFSQAHSFPAAMAARTLIGIGTASVLMATFTIFTRWFSKQEFGRVSGFMVAVGNLGNLAATAPLALAVAAVGWRASFLTIGVVQGAVTLLVFSVVRDRPPGDAGADGVVGGENAGKSGMLAAWKEIFGSRDFWLLGFVSFFWYGNYLALQGLWGGPYLMEVLHLTRTETGRLLMFTSIGFICGSMFTDTIARKVLNSYKKTLLIGQVLLTLLMCGVLGPMESLSPLLLAAWFFSIGLAVSSGVMIYPIIRNTFPVRIVGTALTSLNFFVLMGAAVTQHLMGVIIDHLAHEKGGVTPVAFHAAFLFPIIGLALAVLFYLPAKEKI
ncbi:MAG TPA: MFS transporter [Geobacteraceae bacterium]|nr:MFS transporter [Geobacteraceae bacterium]